jgi:hypothetical protein
MQWAVSAYLRQNRDAITGGGELSLIAIAEACQKRSGFGTASATTFHAERQRASVEIRPASVIFEDALADAAVVGVSDEQQGAVLTT